MPHRLIGLNTWSLGWALRFQKTQAIPSVSLYTCKLYIKIEFSAVPATMPLLHLHEL